MDAESDIERAIREGDAVRCVHPLATAQGEHFGYPFCHQGGILDPVYGKYASCADFVLRQAGAKAVAEGPAITLENHCIQCHGPKLAGQESIPPIAGQHIEYLTAQLKAFRAGTRGASDGNMTSAVSRLSDAEIELLADYVSGLNSP